MADHAALSRLLGPDMTPEQVLTTIWDHSPWLRRGAPASNQAPFDGLLTLEDMDELLMRARLPGSQAELLLFENLKSVSTYATPHMAFAFGASIILNHTDKVWPPANALCALPVSRYSFANLYLPNNSQTARRTRMIATSSPTVRQSIGACGQPRTRRPSDGRSAMSKRASRCSCSKVIR